MNAVPAQAVTLPPYPTAEGLEVEELGLPPIAAPHWPMPGALAVMGGVASQLRTTGFPGLRTDANGIEQARAAVAELVAFADSALHYVDEAAKAERERHQANGSPNSQALAQTVADGLRAALRRVGGDA